MFEQSKDDPWPVLEFFKHQLFAVSALPLTGFVFAAFLLGLPSSLRVAGYFLEAPLLLSGFVVGYKVPESEVSLRIATWVWCLPLVSFVLLLNHDVQFFGLGPALTWYFSPHPGDDNSLSTLFFTLPTWSALSYSVGAKMKMRAKR